MKFRKLVCYLGGYKGLVILPGLFCFWLFGSCSANSVEQKLPKILDGSVRPSLLLLNTYNPTLNVQGWLMSEKLDGVRAYWDGKHLSSRQGKRFAAPVWFTENFPPFELDGELWLDRSRFEDTVSIVNRETPHEGWKDLTYQIFEVPHQKGGLLKRLDVLSMYLRRFPAPYIRIIQQKPINSNEEVEVNLKRVLATGGEGLVLREADAPYQEGRSNFALKVKLKEDAECRVKGYTEGKGKYLGQVGALLCELIPGQFESLTVARDRIIKIGSGLSDADRAAPPAIGETVTFQYIGLTKRGLPRFPVFWRVRTDWEN